MSFAVCILLLDTLFPLFVDRATAQWRILPVPGHRGGLVTIFVGTDPVRCMYAKTMHIDRHTTGAPKVPQRYADWCNHNCGSLFGNLSRRKPPRH